MQRPVPKHRPTLGLCLALSAAVGVGCSSDDTQTLQGVVRNPPLAVATISLPDARNDHAPTPMKAPSGELLLVYFGYTSCPDVCPTTLSDISVALQDLAEPQSSRVTVAMTTVDPERDTDQVLIGYLDHFFDRSLALRTTENSELDAATRAFGVQFEVEDHAAGDSYDVAHTAVTYVVDDTGTVVVEWPFGMDSRDMTSDLTTLLDKEQT